jgi:CheY-like chemotaxis protein
LVNAYGLAGGVAHDFNNMLGVIIGHTELALTEVDRGGALYDDLLEIKKASDRSANLTRQLLAFARKQTVVPKVLNLNDAIANTLSMLRRLIGEDVNLEWTPVEGLSNIKIDPGQVDQILANLCVNARDAISGVGKITIDTRNVTIDDVYVSNHAGVFPGEYVLLSLSDDGCGMDQSTLAYIFEPFFTTKPVGQGTGLGLATVYGIVKQNDGFIDVVSEVGRGTTFKIYLPEHTPTSDQANTKASIAPLAWGNESILLVEDEPQNLRTTRMILERLGYKVQVASTPSEALRVAKIASKPFDLLLTDVVMPEMSGLDLAKELAVIFPTMKSLFVSGYASSVIAHEGVLSEEVHFMSKPFSLQALANKVREVLGE